MYNNKGESFKGRTAVFRKMEPINRNINSGDDDNVETLTDNADGNDVGME